MRAFLDVLSDEQENIWLDASSPVEVVTEERSPHRVAVRTSSLAAGSEQPAKIWLRFNRSQAYQLLDLLREQVESANSRGAEGVTKNTILKGPINGGVNRSNGNMVLLFEGSSGLRHRFELPFDQSGMTMEIIAAAVKSALDWNDPQGDKSAGSLQRVNVQPREAEWLMLGEDPKTGNPILIVRLVGGFQFSLQLDRQILEEIRKRPMPKRSQANTGKSVYDTVAEDLSWLRDEWCTLYEPPSDADLRRGSAVLRRLLVDGVIQAAWRQCGLEGQPQVAGPDMKALAAHQGFELRHVASMIAGGGRLNGIEAAMIGSVRAFNPATGKGPDDDEGFAVKVVSIVRDAREAGQPNPLSALVNRSWSLNKYLDAPAAERGGLVFSRRQIIQYFANYSGGTHLDLAGGRKRKHTQIYKLIHELSEKVSADTKEGLHFELLSIGQAIGGSTDLQKLAARIRESGADGPVPRS